MDLIPAFLSDLIAGFIGTAIVGAGALLARVLGPGAGGRIVARLRRLGWPFVASVFFGVSLTSAVLRGGTLSIIVLSALLALTALVMLLRFGPQLRLPAPVDFVRRYPWRILTAIFFVTTITLFLLNLGDGEDDSDGERITFVVSLDDTEMLVFRGILDELEPELGTEIFLMNVDSSRYVARLDKMVAAGDMKWDLIAVDNNMLGLLAEKDLVEELSAYREYDDLIPKSLLPSLRAIIEFDDKLYFAPFRPNVKIAFYNEQKFAQYALLPPRTWEELLEVARVFKEKEGVGRVAIQGYPGPATAVTVFEFVKAAGGDPLTLDDEGSRKAFAFLQQLEPYLAPEYAETRFDTANELLIDDQVYLVSNWTFGIKVVVEDAEKEGIKAYSGWQGSEGEVHVLGGDVLAVPKGAPHGDKAIELIEMLLSKETQQTMLSRLRWVPVRLDAYEASPPELATHFQAVDDAMSFAVPRPNAPQWTMVEAELDRCFDGLIREGNDTASLEGCSNRLGDIPTEYTRYPVKPWDTLEVIATKWDTTVDILAEANGITPRTSVGAGTILLVPRP